MAGANWAQFFKDFSGVLPTAVGVAGNIAEGSAAKAQANAQASISEAQAASERRIAGDQERDFRKRQSAEFAKRRAAMGASGTDIGTGTPLLAMGDFASEVELQAQRIREGGSIRSSRLEQEADLSRLSGRSLMQRGFSRAGASLLTGVGNRFDKK